MTTALRHYGVGFSLEDVRDKVETVVNVGDVGDGGDGGDGGEGNKARLRKPGREAANNDATKKPPFTKKSYKGITPIFWVTIHHIT